MIWIYILVGGCAGLIGGFVSHSFAKNEKEKKIANKFSLVLTIFFIVITKWYIIPNYYAFTFEKTIKKEYPIFELLSNKFPEEFNNYIKTVKPSISANNQEAVLTTTEQFLGSLFIKYAVHADNKSIFNYIKTTENFYKTIYQSNPSSVIYIESSSFFSPNEVISATSQFDEKYFKDVLLAKQNVIKSALENSLPSISEIDKQQAKSIFTQISQNLITKYGTEPVKQTFLNPNDIALSKKNASEIIITFYQELIDLGQDKAALVFKYLLEPLLRN